MSLKIFTSLMDYNSYQASKLTSRVGFSLNSRFLCLIDNLKFLLTCLIVFSKLVWSKLLPVFFPKPIAFLIFPILVSCNCILLVAEAKYLDIILDFSPFLYLRSNLSGLLAVPLQYNHSITTLYSFFLHLLYIFTQITVSHWKLR